MHPDNCSMFTIALCDDNLKENEKLSGLIENYCESHPGIVSGFQSFSSPTELLNVVENKMGFDVYLLDILMPDLTGIEVAQRLRAKSQESFIVFLTFSEDFALEAFRVGALQYLVKPIEKEELFAVLDRALTLAERRAPKTILINTVQGKERIPLSSIVFVECRNHILSYHLSDGRALTGRTIRTSFEVAMGVLLAERNFIHPHKSFIINADYVERLTAQTFLMAGGFEVPITKSRYAQARSKYLQYFDLSPGN